MMWRNIIVIFLLVGAVSACSPTVATRGNLVSDNKIAQVKPYYATRYDVNAQWGPPTTIAPFDDNTWYYIGARKETMGIFKEETAEQRIIRVKFDEYDTVIEIAELDPKNAQTVEMVERTTPTAGKEFTLLQQLIGNVGRFNSLPGGASSSDSGDDHN